jgi:hypothetical protein
VLCRGGGEMGGEGVNGGRGGVVGDVDTYGLKARTGDVVQGGMTGTCGVRNCRGDAIHVD